jgi:hypothetical protein
MPIAEVRNAPWTRKHDKPGHALIPRAHRIVYPKTLAELIEICRTRASGEQLKAAGSHWALSEAAISENTFIETHDPNEGFQALGRTLYEVIPGCMTPQFLKEMVRRTDADAMYLVHVETGKRVYQLYSELDLGEGDNRDSLAFLLNQHLGGVPFSGPWAFATLGGAGGQTVFGAITTGTHGGDFKLPPIADFVMAVHLVADGGKHYWIEPKNYRVPNFELPPMTDDAKLRNLYEPAGAAPNDFEIIRDDTMFNAVLISAGRFGAVYSVVLRAVRQYSLHEERRLTTWKAVRDSITKPDSDLYQKSADPWPNPGGTAHADNRFLQVAVSLAPHNFFQGNLCGVTKRWNDPAATPKGHAERVGNIIPGKEFDTLIQAPRFELAGNSHSYNPDAESPNFLERACSNSNFMDGVLEVVIEELKELVDNNKVVAGGVVAGVAVVGGSAGLLALAAAIAILIPLLAAFLAALKALGLVRPSLGSVMNDLKNILLDHPNPLLRAAGVFIWQCIYYQIFKSQQKDLDFDALSYAIMDRHDYLNKSCEVHVDSIEVFFDAKSPMLPCYVDALIAFETWQEFQGRSFAGYASLRFCGKTRALLGMEGWDTTCAVEVAGLKDVSGTTELVEFALALALDPNFGAVLHWGQRNPATKAQIEAHFGDRLKQWRVALGRITDHGRLNGFSSDFTLRTGLEP